MAQDKLLRQMNLRDSKTQSMVVSFWMPEHCVRLNKETLHNSNTDSKSGGILRQEDIQIKIFKPVANKYLVNPMG